MKSVLSLAAVSVALFAAAPSAAQTYDAFASFNGTQGAGNFLYGEVAADLSSYYTFTANTNCFISGATCLQQAPNSDVPGFTKGGSPAFQYNSVNVPSDRLIAHPDDDSDLTFVAFVAPVAGAYRFLSSFNTQDVNPSGVSLYQVGTTTGGSITGSQIGQISGSSPSFSFSSGPVQLAMGQAYGFALGNGGSYANDSTGVRFAALAGVPEPATWALMILGFGATGAALRRRQKIATRVRFA